MRAVMPRAGRLACRNTVHCSTPWHAGTLWLGRMARTCSHPLKFIASRCGYAPMALGVSYVLAGIGLALLLVYGADVAAIDASGEGFLPLDAMTRGIGLGTPPIILSLAAFFISRREPASPLGGLILATGILIVVGGVVSMSTASDNAARAAGEGGGLIGIGAAIAVLGVIKIWKSISGGFDARLPQVRQPRTKGVRLRPHAIPKVLPGVLRGVALPPHRAMNWIESAMRPVLDAVADNVYPGVFLAALLETVIPPIPSELIFPLAGYVILDAGMSWLHIPAVGVTGGAGATVGAYAIFLAARHLGRPGLLRCMGRIRISEARLAKAERWFAKYGDKSVLLGRCVPGVRELVSVPAGILDMGTPKFLAYTFAGSCAWSTGLTAAGYYLGRAVL